MKELRDDLERLLGAIHGGDRYHRMLCGIAAASHALLTNRELAVGLGWALDLVMRTTDADRISVFERRVDDTGDEVFVRTLYRAREGVDAARVDAFGALSPRALGAEHWRKQLLRGQSVRVTLGELEGTLRDLLHGVGVTALLLVPVQVDRATWGFVGFYALHEGAGWSGGEECVLRALSSAIAAAVERAASDERQRDLQKRVMRAQKLDSLALFAGGVAHDLKNLLTVVHARAGDDPLVQEAGQRSAELCEQLLQYSRLGSELATQRTRLDAIARETARLLSVRVPDGVALDMRAVQDVPEVIGDPTQLRQIAMNLIVNAAEALADGGGTIRVATRVQELDEHALASALAARTARPGPHVVLDVEDDGPGIADELRVRVFDPLFTTKDDGSGLGLSTVLAVTLAHRGAVLIDTAVGRGTRFSVALPVAPPAEPGESRS